MRIFIDTNVFLDLLWKRKGFLDDSLRIFDLAVDGKFELLISDLSIANIKYLPEKISLLSGSMKSSRFSGQYSLLFPSGKPLSTRHLL